MRAAAFNADGPGEAGHGTMPDDPTVLDIARTSTGRHDLHIVAFRNLRRAGVRCILLAAAQRVSGTAAGLFQPVLLRLWSTRAVAASCRRSVRHICVSGAGVAQSLGLAAG